MPKPRLSILDILHRTVVYSLAGLTVWTAFSAVMVHRETLQKGRGSWLLVWRLNRNRKMESRTRHPVQMAP
ncbi:hypothetical protein GYMLUDRAFT_35080, partial [Collybiopsis luxurians FD-317 M1]